MDLLHPSTLAHYRRSMFLEEGTFDAPPVVDFSYFAQGDRTVGALSHSAQQNTNLPNARDAEVTRHRNGEELTAEYVHPILSGHTSTLVC